MRELAQKRLRKNLQQSLKYLVLVFNDFFILALIFLFGALMFWYAQSMKKMPTGLWFYRPLVGVIIWLPLISGKLVTLLEPADLHFLLPQDKQMRDYLKPMLNYSLIVPTIILVLIAGILFPFATLKAEISPVAYVVLAVVVLLAKVLQLKLEEYNLYSSHKLSLPLLSLLLLLALICSATWTICGYIAVILILGAFFMLAQKQKNVALFDWQYAVNQEQGRKNRVYSAFSMFTDVKEKKISIKRRKYLDFLLPKSLAKEEPNKFLYRRSLLRNPEYLNLLVRMTAFAILISWLVQNWLWAFGLSCLVIFLTVYQLLPLVSEFDDNVMYRIYPIEREKRGQDLVAVLKLALGLQWLIISLSWLIILPISLQLAEAILGLLIFSIIILWLYLPIKIKKRKI